MRALSPAVLGAVIASAPGCHGLTMRAVAHLVSLMFAVGVVAGCGFATPERSPFGPIPDEATAVRAATVFTSLIEPITVLKVEQGRAGELVWTPIGLQPDEAAAKRERAKRERPAWAVTLSGFYPTQCHDQEPCPLAETQQQLAIDRDTGAVLLEVIGGKLDPGPNLDVRCPGDPRCPPG